MEQQFKVGDIVEVTNPGKNFSTHEDAFKVFGFRDKSVNRPFNKGEIGEVFNTGIINDGERTVSIRHKDGRECLIGISGVKLKSSNTENLTITKERVLQAAAKCSTAKATLEILFPEAFEGDDLINSDSVTYREYPYAKCLRLNDRVDLITAYAKQQGYKGIILNSSFNWEIKKINGSLSLIPTRKTP